MKKLLFLLLIIAGCSKDESFCWECWKDTSTPTAYTSYKVELCGLSEKEIGTTIAANTYEYKDVKYSMRCQKK